MLPLTVRQTLHNDGRSIIVTAVDPDQREFVGVARRHGEAQDHDFVFMQVDRVTLMEYDRGLVDLRTVMDQRCSGMVVEATGYGELDEVMTGAVVHSAFGELPMPGPVVSCDLEL
ncbi:hypothetical protein [Methylibium rhizosphaerae]|jgi:L-asparaginase/Glu-tRNA(Gln) amidotransferase subunit D|uniref:hypothetical protein n=1 Tax=Methylibium rhizosphaerae TaxID=2570323 RepID=UPI00112C7583|nr:hypothetical protein [Methylibium rhizosphaerae]